MADAAAAEAEQLGVEALALLAGHYEYTPRPSPRAASPGGRGHHSAAAGSPGPATASHRSELSVPLPHAWVADAAAAHAPVHPSPLKRAEAPDTPGSGKKAARRRNAGKAELQPDRPRTAHIMTVCGKDLNLAALAQVPPPLHPLPSPQSMYSFTAPSPPHTVCCNHLTGPPAPRCAA